MNTTSVVRRDDHGRGVHEPVEAAGRIEHGAERRVHPLDHG